MTIEDQNTQTIAVVTEELTSEKKALIEKIKKLNESAQAEVKPLIEEMKKEIEAESPKFEYQYGTYSIVSSKVKTIDLD